jgi:hypothetical protein
MIHIGFDLPLRQWSEETVLRNGRWYGAIRTLLEDLNKLPYAVIKGDVLSQMAYGDTGFRHSNDIDILVPRSELRAFDKIMLHNGFEQAVLLKDGSTRPATRREQIMMVNSHQTLPYVDCFSSDSAFRLEIDVNHDLFWSEYQGLRPDMHDFLSDTIEIEIYGQSVRSLTPIKAFIQVCLHHYREMNTPYIFRVKNPIHTFMFEDIYRFYKRHFQSDIETVVDYADNLGVKPYLYWLLYYTEKIFDDAMLSTHLHLFCDDPGMYLLERYGLTEAERKIWCVEFAERLNRPSLFDLIRPDLSGADLLKIEQATSIFDVE